MLVKLELWQWFLRGFCTNTTVQCGKSCAVYLLAVCDLVSGYGVEGAVLTLSRVCREVKDRLLNL